MYRFARTTQLNVGNPRTAFDLVARCTEKVNQVVDLDFTAWGTFLSQNLGAVAWTTTVEDLAALEAADAKTMADDALLSLMEEINRMAVAGTAHDHLSQILWTSPDMATSASQAQYVAIYGATALPGNASKAVELGLEGAELGHRLTGRPGAFEVGMTGENGMVSWSVICETVEQLQKATELVATDEEFGKFVEERLFTAFHPRSTTDLYRRLA